jgi:hypothetical protein
LMAQRRMSLVIVFQPPDVYGVSPL